MIEVVFFRNSVLKKRLFLVVFLFLWISSHLFAEAFDFGFRSNDTVQSQKLRIYVELSSDVVRVGDVLTLTLIGRIDEGHHIYSVLHQGEFSPEPTRVVIEGTVLTALKEMSESTPKTIIDKAFEQLLKVHENDFWMKENYLVNDVGAYGRQTIHGRVEYQVCDNKICSFLLARKFEFSLEISGDMARTR